MCARTCMSVNGCACVCTRMYMSERDRVRELERVKENVFEKERVHFCSKKEKDERAKKIFEKTETWKHKRKWIVMKLDLE